MRTIILALAGACSLLAQTQVIPTSPRFIASTQNAGTDVVCALHADVISGLTCNNQVSDATSATAFASTVGIPAGTLGANTTTVNLTFGYIGSASAASAILSIKLGSTVIYTAGATISSSAASAAIRLSCEVTAGAAASATTPVITACVAANFSGALRNSLISNTTKSIAVDTTVAQTLSVTVIFGANTAGNALWLYSIGIY